MERRGGRLAVCVLGDGERGSLRMGAGPDRANPQAAPPDAPSPILSCLDVTSYTRHAYPLARIVRKFMQRTLA